MSLRSCDWISRYSGPSVRTFNSFANSVSVLALLKRAISSLLFNAFVISLATTSLHRKSLRTLQHVTIHFSQRLLQCRSLLLQFPQVFLNHQPYSFMSLITHFPVSPRSSFVCTTPDVFRSSAILFEAVETSVRSCLTLSYEFSHPRVNMCLHFPG